MQTKLDIVYGTKPAQLLDWYLPDEPNGTTIVWFHGGGIEAGSRKDGTGLAQQAAARGYGFVSVEYSMYPAARWPEFILDAAQSVAWVMKHTEEKIIVTGQSAGAYLTMMLCLNHAYLQNAGADRSRITAFISDSAQQTTHYNVLRERGTDSRAERIDEAAALYWVGAQPLDKPLLLICYENDMPCRVTQNKLALESIRHFQPDAPVDICVLPGGHVAGSTKVDENGEYPYLRELFRFVEV